jgi:peptidoglycan/xylan/chitin deacetylase (PgdA/CDA1 family)
MTGLPHRLAESVRRRLRPRALILLYHRIAESPRDPWGLAVTPQHFDEHLAALRRAGAPVTLRALVSDLKRGAVRPGSVVVTFDDGYADNATTALPLLERHDVPATCFVTTGAVASAREFWWDELERLLLGVKRLPAELRLAIAGREALFRLPAGASPTAQPGASWRAWEDDRSPRAHAYRWCYERLFPLPDDERRAALAELAAAVDGDVTARPTHRCLSRDELARLAQSPLIEIGAHAATHTPLAALSPTQQDAEIRESKRYLEQAIGRSLESFAYPYGRPGDWDPGTATRVSRAGFACACTTVRETVRPTSNLFQLPRVAVEDCDGAAFAAMFNAWLGGWRALGRGILAAPLQGVRSAVRKGLRRGLLRRPPRW